MNLLGTTPLLAAVLLAGGHPGAKPTPHPASLAVSSAVLSQVSSGKWQTTLPLNGAIASKCPQRSDFALETTAPDKVIPPPAVRAGGYVTGQPRYCRRITLNFSGLNPIPASAVLILRAPGAAVAAIPVSFVRPVSLRDYFGLPAAVGLVLLAALFLLAVIFVKVYDRVGAVVRPFRTRAGKVGWNSEFWQWTVMASGAWTVGDSWATNIATVTAILGTVLGTTAAASTIFPGVALDRFALVNLLAGALITAVPLVFAILYARWTARFPGPTPDSTIAPQAQLPKDGIVSLGEEVAVAWRKGASHDRGKLDAGTTIKLRGKTFAMFTDGSPVSLAPGPDRVATLAAGTVIASIPDVHDDAVARAIRAHSPLTSDTQVRLTRTVVLRPAEQLRWLWIRSGQNATIAADLPAAPPTVPALPAGTQVRLAAGAVATLDTVPAMAGVSPVNRAATLPAGAKVSMPQQAGAVPAGAKARLRGRVQVKLAGPGAGSQYVLNQDPAIQVEAGRAVRVTAPAGATITLPGGGALGTVDPPGEWPIQVKDGGALQVPPGNIIKILAGSLIATPGGPDLLVGGESILQIGCTAGLIAVAADNVTTSAKPPDPQPPAGPGNPPGPGNPGQAAHQDKPTQADVSMPCPVFLTAPGGVKITVAGTADVELPAGLAMTAPRRKAYVLRHARHLTVPMPANTLGASLRLVIVAALMTMFGVGAQLGIAGVLLYDYSDASTDGRRIALALIGIVAMFLLYYSTTAIRALADPQPGSSMSAVPGTSFTL